MWRGRRDDGVKLAYNLEPGEPLPELHPNLLGDFYRNDRGFRPKTDVERACVKAINRCVFLVAVKEDAAMVT